MRASASGLGLAITLLCAASYAHGHRATEQYIPIGQSPGLSKKYTTIGLIASVDTRRRSVTIGDRVMIGHGARILSSGHRIPDAPESAMRWSGADAAPVTIEQDAWIGAGAIVLGGVSVGRGAVVAAGAVVSKPVPDHAIVGGVPARLLRQRGVLDNSFVERS